MIDLQPSVFHQLSWRLSNSHRHDVLDNASDNTVSVYCEDQVPFQAVRMDGEPQVKKSKSLTDCGMEILETSRDLPPNHESHDSIAAQ